MNPLFKVVLVVVLIAAGMIGISGCVGQTPAATTPAATTAAPAATTPVTTVAATSVATAPAAQQLASDFTPCSGMNTSEKVQVAYHRILLAKSSDGLNFTRMDKLISDRASVPDMVVDKDGNVRIYYVLISCREQGADMHDIPVVAISYDNGQNWVYKKLVVEGPSEATHCKVPGGFPTPVDPEVLLMSDGTYRLYATCTRGSEQGTPMTFVFSSSDGINFSGGQITYVPQSGGALDPVVFKVGSQWRLYNGNSEPATSQDGITFTKTTTGTFCPFKFTDSESGTSRCYIIGDALTLDNPTRYRFYLFGDTAGEGIKSIISTDGEDWSMEQGSGEYILSVNSAMEYYKLAFPTVAKLKDGSYLMAYETFIPGTPSSITSGGGQAQQNPSGQSPVPTGSPLPMQTPPSGQQPMPSPAGGQQKSVVGCGDGVCDSIEKSTGGCPQDC
jgi:hypothetical protein